MTFGLWRPQGRPNGTRAVKYAIQMRIFGGLIFLLNKNRRHTEAYWKERNSRWRGLFPLVIQAVKLFIISMLQYFAIRAFVVNSK